MSDQVLVTGGTGYVAGWCITTLLERGFEVRTTVRKPGAIDRVRAAVSSVEPGDRLTFAQADLTADDGWSDALDGCRYVLHVASPLGAGDTKTADELIVPARDGTVRVIRAAVDAGVERVVMTSACAAAQPSDLRRDVVTDETLWTDPGARNLTPYRLSKVLAERAAWETMRGVAGTTLATVLPGAVFGPLLGADTLGSVQVIARLLQGRMPGLPRFGYQVVDVRDLADLHIRAMTSADAANERFIGAGDLMMTADIAAVLRDRLGEAAASVPTKRIPDTAVRAVGRVDGSVRSLLPALGRRHRHSNAKAEHVLGWIPRPGPDTVVDCATSLIDHGWL